MGQAVSARRGGVLCAAIASGALALLFFSAPAAGADLEFCPIGEGAGQCGAPDDPDSASAAIAASRSTPKPSGSTSPTSPTTA